MHFNTVTSQSQRRSKLFTQGWFLEDDVARQWTLVVEWELSPVKAMVFFAFPQRGIQIVYGFHTWWIGVWNLELSGCKQNPCDHTSLRLKLSTPQSVLRKMGAMYWTMTKRQLLLCAWVLPGTRLAQKLTVTVKYLYWNTFTCFCYDFTLLLRHYICTFLLHFNLACTKTVQDMINNPIYEYYIWGGNLKHIVWYSRIRMLSVQFNK